jgi:hypothetical protein
MGIKILFLENIHGPQESMYMLLLHTNLLIRSMMVTCIQLYQCSLILYSASYIVFLYWHKQVELECCDLNSDQCFTLSHYPIPPPPPPPHIPPVYPGPLWST